MDLRIEKTRRGIINAFLQLRSRKKLEKITVKELAALAEINKATFYLHYHDIYHLSETLEEEVVQSTLNAIEHPDCIFSDNKVFVRELGEAFMANEQMIKIIFEGSRSIHFVDILEKELRRLIMELHPEYLESHENNMTLTYILYGAYYTYNRFRDDGTEKVFRTIGKLSEGLIKQFDK